MADLKSARMVNTMFIDVDEDLGNFGRVARDDFFQ
ncbi:hypothetical protein O164_27395 [Pseudomonas taiwanensis SJ9]|jgi:hypothetical protein|uniref:Uncharacterized protein n=2 Tax=Pseudomonas TaxID=286 RepID=V7D3C3_9PSED|nr:hypothetical protein U771_16215 [Pseudomonas sp. TKP]ESW36837.1 hypothetical protein O164_27395 [Pseudomonas taiwanensis SJ9]|tara:strand:- start:2478 stop:2582 length:105 start_codon:yes stop_codon:yes gene_type:complete